MTNSHYPALFTPVTIRGKVFRNRLIGSPVGAGGQYKGQRPGEHTLEEIRARSRGMACYVVGETDISPTGTRSYDIATDYDWRDLSEENLLPYQVMAQTIHENGALATIEICHCGGSKVQDTGVPIYGPSAMVNSRGLAVLEMDQAVIQQTIRDFADCAFFMKQAGFDGVMGHFGHGWLITQFLSPITNKRTDGYGGSAENRCRFPLEVLRAIRERCGEDFLIDMRVSGEEQIPGGYTVEDFLTFCRLADPIVDLINVSEGHYRDPVATKQFPGMFAPRGCNAPIAQRVKQTVTNAKVSVVGGINSPALCSRIVTEGQADFVFLCRQLTADPDFATKLWEGREAEIRPCTYCFTCFPGPAEDVHNDPDGEELGSLECPLTPPRGYDSFPPPEQLQRVLVVGGGIAGLRAAYIAAIRGHTVTLVEKTHRLGGILNCVRPDPHKEGFARYLDAMIASVKIAGVDVRLNTVATPALLADVKPDVILAAVGASPAVSDIPGMDGANVLPAVGAMGRLAEIGQRVVIVGGGLIGSELAIYLREQGRTVSLVVRSKLARHAPRLHRKGIRLELAKGVDTYLKYQTLEVTPQGVWVQSEAAEKTFLPCDTVISAVGLVSNTQAVEALKAWAGAIPVEVLGDCKTVGMLADANKSAWKAACHIGTSWRPPQPSFGPGSPGGPNR